ncbi:TetR/AcrR family transcriptional regulator [Homoserinibacter sp. YIM 151385]|uniref:TetR/AcrR family transcriptional regulator n=1 Tax=Homoserinibacter sp. YIM 151385 TaxID=2985506 RepID=UPI0022F11C12|nr:TetR/AcrR family transcriptional regulator [Homoserinibacter sp. YIM 151385]WBU38095.1 TetR/AcrR family transcriptional regulator [Homoserinibacter sp. YIM 151385]
MSQIENPSTPRRADRTRNRARLVTAARDVLHEQGIDAPLSTIARQAGLSAATLYRHFPDRGALLAAVYERELDHCREVVHRAVDGDAGDAGASLFRAVREFAVIEAEQPGVMTALTGRLDVSSELAQFRREAFARLDDLIARARRERSIREDLSLDDIRIVLTSIRAVVHTTPADARTQALRVVELFERGCRTVDRRRPS